jgi:hypothetical protein
VNDFIAQQGIGTWPGPDRFRPAGIRTEWGIQVHDNTATVVSYDSQDAALRTLEHYRKTLRALGIPEEYWPILLSRTVETTVGSWRYHGE